MTRTADTKPRAAGAEAPAPAAPAIDAATFAARRERLMEQLGEGAAAVFVGASEARRNGDVDHEFRQTSTFHYLTGFDEPDAVCLLRPGTEEPYLLFVPPRDPDQELWLGPRAGVDGAVDEFGADAALPNDDLEEALPELLEGAESLHYSLGPADSLGGLARRVQEALLGALAHGRAAAVRGPQPIERVLDPFPLVSELRLRKEPAEVAALRRAVEVTGAGIERAMRVARPGLHEYEVQAELEAEYRRLGSPRNGFPSIVATGANACTLHYVTNRARIAEGDLLLVDTGAEVDYYGADVTRTFPAGGRFSTPQRAIYELVLAAQRAGIAAVAPGVRFHEVHDAAVRTLAAGLLDLDLLEGELDQIVGGDVVRAFYPHSTSHWLGLDVHDVGRYRLGEESVVLEPGMVLTVEPGLYIRSDAETAPAQYRGIGVRIEDDVLVTETGHDVLSAAIPSDPDELERIVAGG
jgi:Xaa-Pro aminopeptidase